MSTVHSVCDIFKTMKTVNKQYNKKEGKEWLDNLENAPRFNNHVSSDSAKKSLDLLPSVWEEKLKSAVNDLNNDLLNQILIETYWNFNEANIIVNNLYEDFKYYVESTETKIFLSNQEEIVDLFVDFEDLFIIGRLIGPLLITGCTVRISCSNLCTGFLVAVGDILVKWIPKGTKYIFSDSEKKMKDHPKLFYISGQLIERYCPMIIFEDSDLNSVLDDLIEFSCLGNGNSYWSVTHAYFQESAFETAVDMLQIKNETTRKLKFLRRNDLENLQKDPSFGSDKFRIFTGWDPRELDLDGCLIKSITILPFRTIDEVTSLVNSRNTACTASIWSDKLSITIRLTKLLQVGTIWINSHGLLHPSVPFESSNESCLPLNGTQLLDRYKKILCSEKNTPLSNYYLPENLEEYPFYKQTIEESVNSAEEGYETLNKMTEKERVRILEMLLITFGILDHEILPFNFDKKKNFIFQPTKNMDVLSFSVPYKTIMIYISEESNNEHLLCKVLYCLLATKNALIVCSPTKWLHTFAAMFKPHSLPDGVVNFLDLNNLETDSKHLKRIGQIFNFNSSNSKLLFNHGLKCDFLYSLFLHKKTVWLPAD